MIKRISTILFNHRYIARFVTDKIWAVLLYFFFFCAVLTIPTIVSITNANLIDGTEYTEVEEELEKINENISFANGKMTVSDSFVFQTSSYIYSFNSGTISEKLVFHFGEDEVSVVEYGLIVSSKTYAELGVDDISINNQNAKIGSIILIELVDKTASNDLNLIKTVMVFYSFFVIAINYLFYSAIFYFLGAIFNRLVQGSIRYKIVLYSLTPLFIFDLLANMFYLTILHYIGIIYAIFVLYRSLKAIVKIEFKKR